MALVTPVSGRTRRLVGWFWLVPALPALGLTSLLAYAAWRRPGWAIGTAEASWWQPSPGNTGFALAFVGVWAGAQYAYWWPRRRRPVALALLVVGGLASLGITLGIASYAPCTGGQAPGLAPVTWALLLLVGNVEVANLGPEAVGVAALQCGAEFPLALQLARSLAISATYAGAGAAAFAVSRQQVDRLLIRFADDVDVVTGLDETVIPLVKALVEEREQARMCPDWYLPSWWEKVRGARRARVVVIHNNRTDPLLGEVRAVGALVLLADPTEPEALRFALRSPSLRLGSGRRRAGVSLRRLFAVSADQRANLDVAEAASTVLSEIAALSLEDESVGKAVVPRVVVRLDDPREARDWRVSHVGTSGWFVDALSVDDLLARSIVDRVVGRAVENLVIAGDGPLASALLDDLVWRRWCWVDLRRARPDQPPPTAWHVSSVAVVGDHAEAALEEWERHRSPCADIPAAAAPPALTIRHREGDWEEVAKDIARAGGTTAVVVALSPETDRLARATRIARACPGTLVFAPDPAALGVPTVDDDTRPDRARPVVRYGPTLLQGRGVPEDSWTALARHQAAWYVRRVGPDGRAARRDWGSPGQPESMRLPEFFREDNLRQHRHILRFLVQSQQWQWVPATPGDPPTDLAGPVRQALVRSEHERWCRLREGLGWRYPTPGEIPASGDKEADAVAAEQKRRSSSLVDWSTGKPRPPVRRGRFIGEPLTETSEQDGGAAIRDWNLETFDRIWERLYQWGIRPVPQAGGRGGDGALAP